MTTSSTPSTYSVGRFTGLVLGLVVVVCISLIGLAGYLKYELDRAEAALVSPDSTLAADDDSFDKIGRALGYSGFIGSAQAYAGNHDGSVLPDMKAALKQADDMVLHLPEKTSPAVRHDLQSILAVFDQAMQKAEKSSADPATSFTVADLTPLYAALPVIDARVANAVAAARVNAQNETHFWAMLLALVSWCSLIVAAAMAAGIYFTLRDRNSAPLRALAQSVKNMARGDMRGAIWGMERQDMVGELARAVDMARYHFSQLPDMALLSDQGPVRLKFEGNTRSMFEAMIRVISRDSEVVRAQTVALTEGINKQQEALTLISSRVEAVLQNVENRAVNGDQQMRQSLQSIIASAQSLKNAQEHAADQLNRIIPYLQERAHGMSEITQLAGKQVTQVLQSLAQSEKGLRASAEGSEEAIKKLTTTADGLGERLFGAINLLQASGKVLAETTETTRSRLDEVVGGLGDSVAKAMMHMPSTPQAAVPDAAASEAATRMEAIAVSIEATRMKLEELLAEDTTAPVPDTSSPRMEAIATAIEATQQKLESLVAEQTVAAKAQSEALVTAKEKLEELLAEQSLATMAQIDLLTTHSNSLLAQSTSAAQTLTTAADHMREEHAKLDGAIGSFAGKMADIGTKLEQQAEGVSASNGLSEDMHLRITELNGHVAKMADKITTLAQKADAPPREPSFVNNLLMELKTGFEVMGNSLERTREQLTTISIAARAVEPVAVAPDMGEQWQNMAAQIEAARSGIGAIITQQIDRLETRIAALGQTENEPNSDALQDTQQQMEQQTQILSELVATLGVLDAHMQDIRSQVAGLRQKAS